MEHILKKIIENKLLLKLENGKLKIFAKDNNRIDKELINEIKENKTALENYLLAQEKNAVDDGLMQEIPKLETQESYELSSSQLRLWILNHFEEGAVAYNIPSDLYLDGTYNVENFKKAIYAVIDRHEILRTTFRKNEAGDPRQWVLKQEDLDFTIDYKDLSDNPESTTLVKSHMAADAHIPFDLATGPLFRVCLFKVKAEKYILYYNMHHIIGDALSMEVLFNETFAYYNAFQEGTTANLPVLRIQYKDYAAWQQEQIKSGAYTKHQEFWKNKFSGNLPVLDLPSQKIRPKTKTFNGHKLGAYLSPEMTKNLQHYCKENGGSLYMGLVATWNALFNRYSGETEIIVGTPVAGRGHVDLDNQIGFYVNTLALKNEIDASKSFNNFFTDVKSNALESFNHQQYPFDLLVEDIDLVRDPSRSSIFDIIIGFPDADKKAEDFYVDSNKIDQIFDYGTIVSKVDLAIIYSWIGNCLFFDVIYNTDVYEQKMIKEMIVHFKQLVAAVLANPEEKLATIDYLSSEEKTHLLKVNNNIEAVEVSEDTVLDIFSKQVQNNPETPAYIFGETQLTYAELDERSTRLGQYLIENYSIETGDLVGIMMDTNEWSMVCMLGILKAGAGYVFIDNELPEDRKGYIIDNAAIKALLIISDDLFEVTAFELPIFSIDIQYDELLELDLEKCTPAAISKDTTAYVTYTSGTTGKPKGVLVSHANIVDYYTGLEATIKISNNNSFGLMSSLSADLGNTVVYGALLSGGTLHGFTKATLMDAESLKSYFSEKTIDCIKIVPSHWKALSSEGNILLPNGMIVFGGEVLSLDILEKIKASGSTIDIINHYGPTETTIGKLLHKVDLEKAYTSVPIGKPFSATSLYVVNAAMELCPQGVSGELLIGGLGVSKGYVNNEELTAAQFVPNKFEGNGFLYKTGDKVQLNTAGEIVFIGRVDDQVKIRGYRVEPNEIALAISGHRNSVQSEVLVKQDQNGNNKLIAYVVSEGDFDEEGLKGYLHSRLPDYMMPSMYIAIDEMPLTSNGKVDRKALPEPGDYEQSTEYVAPRNQIEEDLCEIWSSLLNVEKVGINDDFFALGGHSLLAIRLISEIKNKKTMEVSIADLFEHPTIAELAAHIEANKEENRSFAITPQERPEQIPLSFAQERLWFIDNWKGSTPYHQPSLFTIKGNVNIDTLTHVFKTIIDRHESLRTVFLNDDGKPYQSINEASNWKLNYKTISEVKATGVELDQFIEAQTYAPFDLAKDYMLRVCVIKVTEDEHILLAVRHHIASDGWSLSLLINEFVEIYQAKSQNVEPVLPELSIQYADYAIWHRNNLVGEAFDEKLAYWENKLKGLEPLELTTDYKRPAVQSTKGAYKNFTISKDVTDKLKQIAQEEGTTLYMVLITAYKTLFYQYTSQTDICIGTTVSNRKNQELEALIGFFVNTLTLRTEFEKDTTFKELLQKVRQTIVEAYDHVAVPFEKVVDKIEVARDSSRTSLFQHLFVFNNNPDPEIQLIDDITLTEKTLELGDHIAKFDITFFVQELHDELSLSINYCVDLFGEARIQQMGQHFENLLSNIVENTESELATINYLSSEEKAHLLEVNNNTETVEASEATVLDIFSKQVEKNPETAAYIFGETQLTYAELDERSTRLGQYLIENYSIETGDLVGIMMDTNEWSMVCMLGILKAGAGYVFIDNELPEDRKGYIIDNAAIKALLIISDDLFEVTAFELPIFSIDIQYDELLELDLEKCTPAAISKDTTAYVTYTSGTTGKPKGVLVSHANIVDYYTGLEATIKISNNNSFGLMSSLSADLGNTVVYGALLSGGTLHGFTKATLMDAESLKSYFSEKTIDCIKIVPSHWKALSSEGNILLPNGMIVFGGEVLSLDILEKIKTSGSTIDIINHYGPTETTIGKLLHKVDLEKAYTSVPIGKPFSATSLYVVNAAMELCPQGVSGELLIGGLGVSKGYVNNEELTAAQFVPNKFEGNGFLYKTGDKVQLNAAGEIVFIGRVDDQVKIRGYRVEPNEIALAISGHRNSVQSEILVKQDQNGNNKLIAYVVSEGDFDEEGLKGYLHSHLPDYMMPSMYIAIDEMPLTSNGKVNRKALPEPGDYEQSTEYVAPRNQVEEDLCEIWSSLLNVEKVGINDGFFELGGDSIIVIQFVSRAKRKGHNFKVQDLFDHQTIAELSEVLENQINEQNVAEQGILEGKLPLTPIQEWYFEEENEHMNHFNMNLLFKIDKNVSESHIKMLTTRIVERHDTLRLKFTKTDGKWEQSYGESKGNCNYYDISSTETSKVSERITEICKEVQQKNNLEEGDLAHFTLIQTPNTEEHNRFFISFHHLAVDGVSLRTILDEMELILDAFIQNVDAELGLKTNSYRDWATALTNYAHSDKIVAQQEYWETIKKAYVPFEADLNNDAQKRATIQTVIVNIDETLTTTLTKSTNKAYNTEINDILLTVLSKTICDWTARESVVIGLEGHGREAIDESIDISNTTGWFTSKYPLLLHNNTTEIGDLIKSVKEQIRNVPDKGLGYGCLKYLNKDVGTTTTLANNSWDLVFNYLGQMDNVINKSNWFLGATENTGHHINESYPMREKLVVKGAIMNNMLGISWDYSDQQYDKETIEKLADLFIENLKEVIKHCETKEDADFTPSDFNLQDKVSISELDNLFENEDSEADGVMKF